MMRRRWFTMARRSDMLALSAPRRSTSWNSLHSAVSTAAAYRSRGSVMRAGSTPRFRRVMRAFVGTCHVWCCTSTVLVQHQTWQVPTNALITRRNLGVEPARMTDPRLRYAAAVDTAEWRLFHEVERRGADSASMSLRRAIVNHRRRIIARLYH